MKLKEKLITVLAVFVLLLLLAGAGFGNGGRAVAGDITPDAGTKTKDDIKRLGGIETRMPENSALVFFRSTLGKKLSGYKAYGSQDEVLCALRTGEIDAMWCCDVTADYLCRKYDFLRKFDTGDMSDIENTSTVRLLFGMALRDDERGNSLKDEINGAIAEMKSDGRLEYLKENYIDRAELLSEDNKEIPMYRESDMKSSECDGGTICIGLSGAVMPLELLDESGNPYGFCVAFADEIGRILDKRVNFEVLDNETIFTSLMSGRIDAVLTYGTGNITTEGTRKYIMTDGYYTMERYMFLGMEN